ncbi:MAG TPA: DNA polymerase III subunit delta' [Methylibium sp.]|uniref:DNA polymerase III subunit delta' n=1 Tax=Methylibium sp. TaxID=2067992 RepID=UPI002DB6E59E|nr:DNA polymerase III subunit delta' [Methylibium sp.]HEU4460617.1 DNA polymerase III subunit delta' [Methylibium sp.]
MAGGDEAAALPPWLEAPLERALRSARGHALLIHGPRGVGQWELGLAIAHAWLCEAQPADRMAHRAACGHCTGCRLIAAGTHPDLRVVVPPAWRETLGLADDDAQADDDAGKSKAKPSKDIKVEAARSIVEFAQQTASRGRGKVVLLFPAERMNPTSANMLLKTLEEPAGATRFLLATAQAQRLLPTVRSRCQPVALGMPKVEQAATWLAARGIEKPEWLLAAAGGSPIEALQRWQRSGIDAKTWQALPAEVLAQRTATLAAWPLPLAVDALQKLCHDLLCVAAGAAPRYFDRSALPAGGEVQRLGACARELANAARHAEHPWHAPLAVEALVQRVADAARGPRATRTAASPMTTLAR